MALCKEFLQTIHTSKIETDELGKAKQFALFSIARPYMRSFHASWFCFFMAFLSWFGIQPLLPSIRKELKLSRVDLANSGIASVAGPILVTVIAGPLCDKFGPRRSMSILLISGAIPMILTGVITDGLGLILVRLFIGILGATFVPGQLWAGAMFSPNIVGTANGLVGGWGNLGGGCAFLLMPGLFQLIQVCGADEFLAWKIAVVIPSGICVFLGLIILCTTEDCPQGDWSERKFPETILTVESNGVSNLGFDSILEINGNGCMQDTTLENGKTERNDTGDTGDRKLSISAHNQTADRKPSMSANDQTGDRKLSMSANDQTGDRKLSMSANDMTGDRKLSMSANDQTGNRKQSISARKRSAAESLLIGMGGRRYSAVEVDTNTEALKELDTTTSESNKKCTADNFWAVTTLVILTIQYGMCFGVELSVNTVINLYFLYRFKKEGCVEEAQLFNTTNVTTPSPEELEDLNTCSILSQDMASLISSLFGLMNLFARALGGLYSDLLQKFINLPGRLIAHCTALVGQGVMLVVFSQLDSVPAAIGTLVIFSTFVQISEGTTFAITPYVSQRHVGTVAGIVGAGGNAGAIVWNVMWIEYVDSDPSGWFWILGIIVLIGSGLTIFIVIQKQRIYHIFTQCKPNKETNEAVVQSTRI